MHPWRKSINKDSPPPQSTSTSIQDEQQIDRSAQGLWWFESSHPSGNECPPSDRMIMDRRQASKNKKLCLPLRATWGSGNKPGPSFHNEVFFQIALQKQRPRATAPLPLLRQPPPEHVVVLVQGEKQASPRKCRGSASSQEKIIWNSTLPPSKDLRWPKSCGNGDTFFCGTTWRNATSFGVRTSLFSRLTHVWHAFAIRAKFWRQPRQVLEPCLIESLPGTMLIHHVHVNYLSAESWTLIYNVGFWCMMLFCIPFSLPLWSQAATNCWCCSACHPDLNSQWFPMLLHILKKPATESMSDSE